MGFLCHLSEICNLVFVVELGYSSNIPAHQIHVRLGKRSHIFGRIGLEQYEAGAPADEVIPSPDPFGVIGLRLVLLHDPLGHLRTGCVRVPRECTIPEHCYSSFCSSNAIRMTTMLAEDVPQAIDLAIGKA
jgi:hypothetical protein